MNRNTDALYTKIVCNSMTNRDRQELVNEYLDNDEKIFNIDVSEEEFEMLIQKQVNKTRRNRLQGTPTIYYKFRYANDEDKKVGKSLGRYERIIVPLWFWNIE